MFEIDNMVEIPAFWKILTSLTNLNVGLRDKGNFTIVLIVPDLTFVDDPKERHLNIGSLGYFQSLNDERNIS